MSTTSAHDQLPDDRDASTPVTSRDRYDVEDYDVSSLLINDLTGEPITREAETEPIASPAPASSPLASTLASPLASASEASTAETSTPPTLPTPPDSEATQATQTAQASQSTQMAREPRPRGKRSRPARYKALSVLLLLAVLLGVATPLALGATVGAEAYATYTQLRAHANSGIQHLLEVKALFTGVSKHPSDALAADRLEQAGRDFAAARSDFEQVHGLIEHTELIHTVTQYLPQYRPQIETGSAASQIGIDVANIGQDVTTLALALSPKLHGSLLTYSNTPLVSSSDMEQVRSTLDTVSPLLSDIQRQLPHLSLTALPINAHQRDEIRQLVQLLPVAQSAVAQADSLMGAADWLLGVDRPRTFLVQTMDQSELRATGGFTGQYGELRINGGRVAPFSLKDIALLEYADNSPTLDQQAPPAYRSWWPFANWGLRDSNLSADFPTSAALAMEEYKRETGRSVDGVITFTPVLISHVLQRIGPITIPAYHETITAQNLESRLHYYQLDNTGIRQEEIVEHVPDSPDAPAQARKLFTARLARTLMDRVRQASPSELLALGQQFLTDLKTRDVQVYVQNAQIENLLKQYGDAGQVDRSTSHDGLFVVQMNVSASKASQYVATSIDDTVSLDSKGEATHRMQMRLVYNQLGPVYGLDTYRDYVRVYVPPGARLLGGDGFDTGTPLCDGPLPACPQDDVYPHNELVCPSGQYLGSYAAPMLNDPYAGGVHPLDTVGPPSSTSSDEPGRAMFAGWVVIPKNCTATVTLSWYVPPLAQTQGQPQGQQGYQLLVQRQAGTLPRLDLTILAAPGTCAQVGAPGLHSTMVLSQDVTFTLHASRPHRMDGAECYVQPTT